PCRIAEQQPGRQYHHQCTYEEQPESRPLLADSRVAAAYQVCITDLAGGERQVGQLQQQKTLDVGFADAVVTDDGRPQHGQQGGYYRTDTEATTQRVVDQGDVQRGEDGKQQYLRHAEQLEGQVQADVGDAELQCADQQKAAGHVSWQAAGPQQRQEQQAGQQDAGKHGKVAVHLAGEILADQAEGDGPEQGDGDEIRHD